MSQEQAQAPARAGSHGRTVRVFGLRLERTVGVPCWPRGGRLARDAAAAGAAAFHDARRDVAPRLVPRRARLRTKTATMQTRHGMATHMSPSTAVRVIDLVTS